MGNALSMALRVRFRNLMDRGLCAAAAAAGKICSEGYSVGRARCKSGCITSKDHAEVQGCGPGE